ncbi:iron-sulfur cluster assembly scaffold protein [Desulfobotulus sp. H1]|uniref:Iron-sulfur cluster assembly scaffold protein n=1 Tax=Desulfobotulus pelophilus TaxID=2823377 RepID=A0ABT3N9J7_9BACT|nr:iron-sulfur cluster assembly scaffold protein [Desulfobotulus pelophilus]MCW7754137.1 iron-sulfur cluster assembly scaffold protein [Desulfobotulus pelophilus]
MEEKNFWQSHSEHYLEMAFDTQRQERISHPDGYGKRTGDCGDTIEFFLTLEEGCLRFVSYQVDGCMNTNACAATISCMAEGKDLDMAWQILPETVIRYLETLPEHELHCAELAAGAFYMALADAEKKAKAGKTAKTP